MRGIVDFYCYNYHDTKKAYGVSHDKNTKTCETKDRPIASNIHTYTQNSTLKKAMSVQS